MSGLLRPLMMCCLADIAEEVTVASHGKLGAAPGEFTSHLLEACRCHPARRATAGQHAQGAHLGQHR
jgi:hypothetical protein